MPRKPKKTKPIESAILEQAEAVLTTPVEAEPLVEEPDTTAALPPIAVLRPIPDADQTMPIERESLIEEPDTTAVLPPLPPIETIPTTTVTPLAAKLPLGPKWETTMSLGERHDAPKIRMGRDSKFRQMVIQFDERPSEETRQRLHDAEWAWRKAEGYWTKQLAFGEEVRGHQEAQTLFADLAANERREYRQATSEAQSR